MFFKELEYIKFLLTNRGYHLTIPRKAIVLEFLKNPQKHFSPLELYEKVKVSYGRASLSTIYRNLKLLAENNIIHEVVSKDKKLYELKLFGKNFVHCHIICTECNKIYDYFDEEILSKIDREIKKIERDHSFRIVNTDINFIAICNRPSN